MKFFKSLCYSLFVFVLGIGSSCAGMYVAPEFVTYTTNILENCTGIPVISEVTAEHVTSGMLGPLVVELNGDGTAVPEDIARSIEDAKVLNRGVIGWIQVDGYAVDHPVLYSESDTKYIRTGINGEYDVRGCIYLDTRCGDRLAPIKMIHGHNMADGTMFSLLPEMLNLSDLVDAPAIVYVDSQGYKEFLPISVYSVDTVHEGIRLDSWASLNDLIQLKSQFIRRSLVPVSKVPTGVELLILDTCWYGDSGTERNLHCIIVSVRVS